MALGTAVFLGAEIRRILIIWIQAYTQTKLDKLDVRRIEALSKRDTASRQRLIESMPDWLDSENPPDINAETWKSVGASTATPTNKTLSRGYFQPTPAYYN